MRKIILLVLATVMTVSLTGCLGSGGPQLPGVSTSEGKDIKKIDASKYNNDLEGLGNYLTDLNYLPSEITSTEMMYGVIGAKAGERYNFTVDNSVVYVELYEYDTDKMDNNAKRVTAEAKKDGEIKVLSEDDSAVFPATLSANGKYLLMYSDNATNESNATRKKNFTDAVKNFHK